MGFWTIFACAYLTVSCIIGILSLMIERANPESFDPFRSPDPWTRIQHVTSVIVMGPIYLVLAMVTANGKD